MKLAKVMDKLAEESQETICHTHYLDLIESKVTFIFIVFIPAKQKTSDNSGTLQNDIIKGCSNL